MESSTDIAPDAVRAAVFGDRLEQATRYATLLATDGVERGLIGPRETGRLWSRHLVNCAAVAPAFPLDARVVDVGSGAGLPGLVLAIARPDLHVDLVESLQRRVDFLTAAVSSLGLDAQVRVIRGRAEDRPVVAEVGRAEWVTARAVAPLDRLVRWCLPLLAPGGRLVALKGSSASAELDEHRAAITRAGGTEPRVVRYDAPGGGDPTTAVVIVRACAPRTKGHR